MSEVIKERSEKEIAQLIKDHLKDVPGPYTIVDVGAAGFYSAASLLVLEGWTSILFEPHPKSYKDLVEGHKGKANVTIINKAVSNQKGTLKFLLHPEPTLSSLEPNSTWYKPDTKVTETTIDVVLLPEELRKLNISPNFTFLKVDAEGFDYRILEHFLASEYKPLVVEHEIQHPGPGKFNELMVKYGYTLIHQHGNMVYVLNKG